MARHDSVSAELARARSVQETMLPAAPRIPGLEIETSYRACKALGGDFFDFIIVDPWRLGIVIADVSGHGTAAALVMSAAKKSLQIFGKGCISPRDALLRTNDSIRGDLPKGMFVTVLYGVLDVRDLRLVFARAGHNPPLVIADGAVRADIAQIPGGPVLGIFSSTQLAPKLVETEVQLRPGDAMLLHTDGLSEAFAPQGEMYGKTRLHQKLGRAGDVPASAFIKELREDVDRFRADEAPKDDEAMVLLRVLGRQSNPQPLTGPFDDDAPVLEELPPLLGRERDIAEISELLSGEAALVTITGPGGVGKTRTSQAVSARLRSHFPAGVFFCELTDAREAWAVCRAVAAAVGVQEGDTALGQRIGNALRGRAATRGGNALLVLDNCEQAAEAVGRCVNEWRARAPGTRFLLTSRVPTGTRGEHLYPLRPLRTPQRRTTGRLQLNEAALAGLAEVPSVDLFIRRAREKSPRFALTLENADTISRICSALDGLPLAIELAAARIGVMSPEKILERLGERFEWLRSREETGHHATLEDVIAWSWDLLSETERDLLAELSVFSGGFVLECAEQVVTTASGADLADLLEGLESKSLLYRETVPGLPGEPRFFLYESVRLFAELRLNALNRGEDTRARWRSALVEYARRWWQRRMSNRAQEARTRYEAEADALLRVAREGTPLELAGWATVVLASTMGRTGTDAEIETLVSRMRAALPPSLEVSQWLLLAEADAVWRKSPVEANRMVADFAFSGPTRYYARILQAKCAQASGIMSEVEAMTRLALEVPGLTPLQKAAAQDRLGLCHYRAGRLEDALECFDAALRVALEQKDMLLESILLAHIGSTHKLMGEFDKSEWFIREAIRLAQAANAAVSESSWLGNLGVTMGAAGKLQAAEACILRALRLTRETGNLPTEAAHLINLAYVYHRQNRIEEAMPLLKDALRIHTETGNRHGRALALANIAALERDEGSLEGALVTFLESRNEFLRLSDAYAAANQLVNIGQTQVLLYHRHQDPAMLAQATESLQAAMRENAEHKFLRNTMCEAELAACLQLQGQPEQARALAKGVLEAEATAPNSVPPAALERAREVLGQ
ncbi:MAG: SpoIIE family protein phosphatase [Planctomycetes bacterium]|nr:SpoIIE family protein phosphatase [Planctomycetota bacterium]